MFRFFISILMMVCYSNFLISQESIYDISINDIDGNSIDIGLFKGKKILFVNVASNCGFTNQYKSLESLHNRYKDKLVVVGVPCNQFGGQEPGEASEIKTFCTNTYNISFLLTEKIEVKGDNQHILYRWLTEKRLNKIKNSNIKWNFQKYLIDEKGNLMDFFYSTTSPISSKIISLIEQ